MPTTERREDGIIVIFLRGYEHGSWTDAKLSFPDKETDGGVDGLATRIDGATLAIEHTLVQPFIGDRQDFAFFSASFLDIEKDDELRLPGRNINVFVPVGTLAGHPKKSVRAAIVRSVHEHLRASVRHFPEGWSDSACTIRINGQPERNLTLRVRVVASKSVQGVTLIRRQQTDNNLSVVIDEAVQEKVPKLLKTAAQRRILILEREHMNLLPERIIQEIDRCRATRDDLQRIDEIWIVETMDLDSSGCLRFERYQDGQLVSCLDFEHGTLIG